MYVWSITPFNRFDIRIRRILKKIYDINKRIPRDYRCAGERIPLFAKEKYEKQVTVPEYETINRRTTRYRKLLRRSNLYHWPQEYIKYYFSTEDAAIECAKRFDHECTYYKWLHIQRHWLVDTELTPHSEDDFEHIAYYAVDKTDVWFKLNCVDDTEGGYHHEYQKQDAPDFLKVVFC